MAAGAAQAGRIPSVDDFILIAGKQESARFLHDRTVRPDHHATEKRPVTMVRAAGIAPTPVEEVSTFDRRSLAGRHIGR